MNTWENLDFSNHTFWLPKLSSKRKTESKSYRGDFLFQHSTTSSSKDEVVECWNKQSPLDWNEGHCQSLPTVLFRTLRTLADIRTEDAKYHGSNLNYKLDTQHTVNTTRNTSTLPVNSHVSGMAGPRNTAIMLPKPSACDAKEQHASQSAAHDTQIPAELLLSNL